MSQSNLIFHKAHPSFLAGVSGIGRAAPSACYVALLLAVPVRASAEEAAPIAAPAAASTETPAPADATAPAAVSTETPAPAEATGPVEATGVAEASTAESTPAVGEAPAGLSPEQSRALWPLTWKKVPGQGVAFGLEEGLWGGSWSQGLRITIPFASNFATTVRGIYLIDMVEDVLTVDAGGRLDFVGRSEVLFNVMRLYGGGGVQVIAPVSNTEGREVRVGGGGHFGFEFFCSPHYSFFLEVGGQGGTVSPGATVLAGLMVYPWTR